MFNAGRLTLARKRRQLTKKELAEKAGLTALTLTRLEAGSTSPSSETVRALAQALKYPSEFFYLNDSEALSTESVSFRSLSSLTARQRDAALGAGELAFDLHAWVANRFELPPVQMLDLRDEDPVAAAEALRTHWGLGAKPIEHMIKLLESKGVRVFSLAEQHKHVDAFSCWRDQVPFIFLNTFKSAERSRFDAAHELGHLVLHIHGLTSGGRDVEGEADAFASAFLVNKGDLVGHLGRVNSLAQLVIAKKRWGVSVAALARTAKNAGLISEWNYRDLCKQMSQLGYRTTEPQGLVREKSILWKMVFDELWKDGITKDRIASELHIPLDEIESLVGELIGYMPPPVPNNKRPALRIVS
ncbi:helix-turn-helix domain-containing protein [Sphaerotilus uruguayifluvii]|uniref:Zn-dependent peptidase ImmA (M78 family)/DNA-binding XRE family transcriptional regulator n=1 Tax=Sphaerotilus uruguayifluvii TaxID=2735897 RepID=A0ABX2FYB4_9BURK|nr:XRE family transcriptional regulator [Leptothrix sp. C29]NRT55009.1 Zn-dependent peptidase ImmA (M78 family)/DNA-binding XRE family transcriptional regulator [Leptothrix sp. C29]